MSRFDTSLSKKAQYAQWGILIAMLVVLLAVGFGLLLQLLWNIVIVDVFAANPISFWQAVGLFIVAKLFFGVGFGGGSHSRRSRKRWAKGLAKHRSEKSRSSTEDADADDLSFENDEAFQEFWRTEGKAAYDAYRENQAD